jgi:hypothetical protein
VITEAARLAVLECQARVWELVRDAAERRDGNAVIELTELAGSLGLLVDAPLHEADQVSDAAREPHPTEKCSRKARRSRKDYPRFQRTKTDLVKIGWSKTRKAEYQHRAPWTLATQVFDTVESLGAKGKRFTGEQLLNSIGEKHDAPSYQIYLVLAWLRDAKVVTQIGRQGYRVVSKGRVADAAKGLIEKLHET